MIDTVVGDEARDLARLADIPWHWRRVDSHGTVAPVIELHRLSWWERWRVAWCRIAAHHFLEATCP